MKEETTRLFKCPRCRKPVAWEGNPWRPFCSEKCRLVDLGKWAQEEYFIAGEKVSEEETDDNN